jgi:hypothetical protein
MKAQIAHLAVIGKSFILLFSIISFLGFGYNMNAQGWSFTPTLNQSDCGNSSYTSSANAILAQFSTSVKLPTQSQCEAIRQMLNGFSTGGDWYTSGNPPIHHYCSITITCTPCSGSDIVSPGQVNPGDVSFDGQVEGKPFFTPHQSEAFEDWARDYKQQLESYGITSILGKKLTPHPIPLTGDKDLDSLYSRKSGDFNPPASAVNPPNQDASGVDLSGKNGIVRSLTSAEKQAKRDEWMEENGLNNINLSQINNENAIDANGSESSGVSYGVDALLYTISKLPGGELPAEIGGIMLNIKDASMENLQNATNALTGNGSADNVLDGQGVLGSAAQKYVEGKALDLGVGGIATRGASNSLDVGGDINFGYKTAKYVWGLFH